MSGHAHQSWATARAESKQAVSFSTLQDILAASAGVVAGFCGGAVLLVFGRPENPLTVLLALLIVAAAVSVIAAVSSGYRKHRQAAVTRETSLRIAKLIAAQAPQAQSPEGAFSGTSKVKSKLRGLRDAS